MKAWVIKRDLCAWQSEAGTEAVQLAFPESVHFLMQHRYHTLGQCVLL